jgi:phosphoribosyl 1,2-cyclic phosphodiesterase/CheY-like chemotaxis protein
MNSPYPSQEVSARRILVVDNDPHLLWIRKLRLLAEGYDVKVVQDGSRILESMEAFRPDLVVLELLMPGAPGELVLEKLRADPRFADTKVIVNSALSLEGDYGFCVKYGVDAYLAKPLDHNMLSKTIRKLLQSSLTIRFWGVRGDIARPGRDTLKYGGNTPCVAIETGKDGLLILDAGSGIVGLGRALADSPGDSRFHVLLSHPHRDHIEGLPYFEPLRRNGYEVNVYGASTHAFSLRKVIDTYLRSARVPASGGDQTSRLVVRDMASGTHQIDQLQVDAIYLDPASLTLGYRLTDRSGHSVAYLTDYEVRPRGDPYRAQVVEFIRDVDVLIHDAVYRGASERDRNGAGHPELPDVLKLAGEARVKSLYLYHHDPGQDDEAIDRKEAAAITYFAEQGLDISCAAAREGRAVLV